VRGKGKQMKDHKNNEAIMPGGLNTISTDTFQGYRL